MASLLIIVIIVLTGCGAGEIEVPNPSTKPGDQVDRMPPNSGDWTIEEASRFGGFDTYWIGEEFRDLPLTRINYLAREERMFLSYGTCTIRGEGGCFTPIQITIRPYCRRGYVLKGYDTTAFRGVAESAIVRPGRTIYVFTGEVAVRISAYGESGGPDAVAEALVSFNGSGVGTAGDPLPAFGADC